MRRHTKIKPNTHFSNKSRSRVPLTPERDSEPALVLLVSRWELRFLLCRLNALVLPWAAFPCGGRVVQPPLDTKMLFRHAEVASG
jgi:hypothetical protein